LEGSKLEDIVGDHSGKTAAEVVSDTSVEAFVMWSAFAMQLQLEMPEVG